LTTDVRIPSSVLSADDVLLDTGEYAEMVGISAGTAANQRSAGTGCPYIKLGGRVLYRLSDLRDFLAQNRVGQ
jgi:hypothetical protein